MPIGHEKDLGLFLVTVGRPLFHFEQECGHWIPMLNINNKRWKKDDRNHKKTWSYTQSVKKRLEQVFLHYRIYLMGIIF